MTTTREQLLAGIDEKPVAFRSVALKGQTVFIEQMTGWNINAWWEFYYGVEKGQKEPPKYIQRAAEMVVRCCVDADGKKLFGDVPAAQLAHDRKLGRFLAEFYEEACRVNGLFVGREAEEAHRKRFFDELDGVNPPSETPAKTCSDASPSGEGKETSAESPTA